MTNEFDKQRHRKAFMYTAAICSLLLIAFIFISWKTEPPAPPVITELIEVNLGDNNEGLGEEEPMAKGDPAPPQEETAPTPPAQQEATNETAAEDKVIPDDNAEETAAPVVKPVAKAAPVKNPAPPTPRLSPKAVLPAANPSPKPTPAPKPRFTMPGAKGPGGNNASQDTKYTQQGNNPKGGGNKGVPGGNPDTYGTKPGGSIDGPKVIKGNRKILSVNQYKFPGELGKAVNYALIRVSTNGTGTFIKFSIGSTRPEKGYASVIRGYLQNIKFSPGDDEEDIIVLFNFKED